MKKIHTLLLISVSLIAAACSSTRQAGTTVQDDVYYSSRDQYQPAPAVATYPAATPAPAQEYSQEINNSDQNNASQYQEPAGNEGNAPADYYQDGQGNTYITNNYYNDNNYDYAYSSNLRRYYSPAYGYGYYDPYYTNLYFYDYYPSSWGVSIYAGYNWWAPSFYYTAPFCYGGFGIGFSYGYGYGYGYSPFYSPGYYPGSYYGYNHGYNHGYNDGYYHGYNDGYYGAGYTPYYYNSYDANTTYNYGPRGGSSTNSPRSSGRQNSESPMSLGEKYNEAIHEGRITNTHSNEQIIQGESRDQKPGGVSPSIINSRENATDKKSPAVTPSRIGETRENTIQDSRQTPSNTREIKSDVFKSTDDVRKQDQNISKPSQGEVRPGNTDIKNQTVPTNPSINDSRNNTPVRQNTAPDKRSNLPSDRTGTGVEKKSTQPDRVTTPVRTQPSNPVPDKKPSTQPEKKDQTPQVSPRKKTAESGVSNDQLKNAFSPSTSDNAENKSNKGTISTGKANQYQNSSGDKGASKNISPRQDSRTPMVQPRNEPRQYKQENTSSSPQRSSSPAPSSRPSQNNGQKSTGSPRR